jgi:acyl-CoA synthetase (AMP-forming)/AMP-acid ligase II
VTRPLHAVPAGDPWLLLKALRAALTASGAAVMPVPGDEVPRGLRLGPVPRRVAVVIETSGTTDAPKRVMLSTDALLAGAAASSVALGGPGQWLLALPAHYIAGVQVLVRSIAAETTPVILPPGHIDPAVFADHAERLTEPLRFTSLVPVQLARLLAAASGNRRVLAALRRFTAILVGGQAVRPELVERAEQLGIRVVRTYGSSETAGGCVYNGVPIGDTEVRVVDGQLEISGAVLAEGYLGDPARTADRFVDVHGVRWYRTGDLGEADAATGMVRVLGRADNVIVSGGEKVSLDAVERVVRALPGLGEAVVVRADDAEWGQVPVVVIAPAVEPVAVVEPVETPALAAIRQAVETALGKAARPARLVALAEIPLLDSGKPDRRALEALLPSPPPAKLQ